MLAPTTEEVAVPKRSVPAWHRVAYLLAGVPFVILALLGFEYPDAFIYIVPAGLCFIQALKPMRILSWVIALLYLVGATAYGVLLLSDLLALQQGNTPRALVDADDSVVFVGLEVFLILVLVAVVRAGGLLARRKVVSQ